MTCHHIVRISRCVALKTICTGTLILKELSLSFCLIPIFTMCLASGREKLNTWDRGTVCQAGPRWRPNREIAWHTERLLLRVQYTNSKCSPLVDTMNTVIPRDSGDIFSRFVNVSLLYVILAWFTYLLPKHRKHIGYNHSRVIKWQHIEFLFGNAPIYLLRNNNWTYFIARWY